jgi:two-component system chemotaxis response regulator CheY
MKWADISVLAVAQSKSLTGMMSDTLFTLGVTDVCTANSTDEAFNLIRRLGPDCAIAAFDKVGFEFTRTLRQGAASPNRYMPVLAFVAGAKVEHVRLAIDSGVHDVAVWPISVDMLRQRLQRAVIAGRPFVQTKEYFGPCRRRRNDVNHGGPERRANAAADAARRAAADARLTEFFEKENAAG